jgi:hypothetical protein
MGDDGGRWGGILLIKHAACRVNMHAVGWDEMGWDVIGCDVIGCDVMKKLDRAVDSCKLDRSH